jgi:hypothetical protein
MGTKGMGKPLDDTQANIKAGLEKPQRPAGPLIFILFPLIFTFSNVAAGIRPFWARGAAAQDRGPFRSTERAHGVKKTPAKFQQLTSSTPGVCDFCTI